MQKQKMVLLAGKYLFSLDRAANLIKQEAFVSGDAVYVNVEIPDGSTIEDVKTLDVMTLRIENIKPEIAYFSNHNQYKQWINGHAVSVSIVELTNVFKKVILSPLEIESLNRKNGTVTAIKVY